jgi:hypothetical protein
VRTAADLQRPPAQAQARTRSAARPGRASSPLQRLFDDSPRVQRLRALGAPIAQRMVINLDPGDDGITKDSKNIGTAGGGAVVTSWEAVGGIANGETLHVVAHLDQGRIGGHAPKELAARLAPQLQGKTDVRVDLHGCFAANPAALGVTLSEEDPSDLSGSYASTFQQELSRLHGSAVPVVASLGAEYTSGRGVTRVRSGGESQQTLDEAVKRESARIAGKGTTVTEEHAAEATDDIIEGRRMEGFFHEENVGRIVFGGHLEQSVDRSDGGSWDDVDPDGPWDPRSYKLQPKLEVGAADDAYEREADRMARHAIARMYAPESAARDEGEVTPAGDPVQTKATPLRRHGGDSAFDAPDHVESGIASARGGGSPLPDALRAPLEGSLGADFGGVRVHSDARSHALNESIQARAFTTGQDVFFGRGAYQPGSRSGQELLAHELTHVMQQSGPDVARRPEEDQIQREPAWKRQADASYDGLVARLDKLVNDNAAFVVANPLAIPVDDGYVSRWNEVIASFASKLVETGNPEDAFTQEPFIYAAFGYAVESLTNWQIATGALNDVLPAHTKPRLQATRGHTRPDLVIVNETLGGDLAWFDITASNSETHINGKTGSGWSTHGWVAEVTYPSLTEETLTTMAAKVASGKAGSSASLGDLAERVKAHRERQALQLGQAFLHVKTVLDAVDDIYSAVKRRSKFNKKVGKAFGLTNADGKPWVVPSLAKGLLRLLFGRGYFTSYAKVANEAGYDSGNQSGGDTETAKELVYNLKV